METALGNIIAKVLYMTDAILEQFFDITPGYINATNNTCGAQVVVVPVACGTDLINNLATALFSLSALGGEIFSALGVAGA